MALRWNAHAQAALADADGFDVIALRLRDHAKLLAGHSTWWTLAGIVSLRDVGHQVRSDAETIAAYAKRMDEHAGALTGAVGHVRAADDLAQVTNDARRMSDLGARVGRLGHSLERYGDDLLRSFGAT